MPIFESLFISKSGVAETLGSGAYTDAVLATGVGGQFRASGVAEEWDTVTFKQAIKETSDGTDFPSYLSGNSSSPANLYTSSGYILGGTGTPEGGVRFDGAEFVNVGTNTTYYVKRDTQYDQAAFIIYTNEADSSKHGLSGLSLSGHIGSTGAGRSGTWVSSPYVEITGGQIDTNTGDLSLISSGSGVYTNSNVTLTSRIVNREGRLLTTAAQIAADPFVSGQRISMLDTDGDVVYADYQIGGSPSFTFTAQERRDVYGAGVRNFGVEFLTVNNNSGTHTTRFYPHANRLSISGVKIEASGRTDLNQSSGNISIATGGITDPTILAESQFGFNRQLINTSGRTGYIDCQFFWWEDVPTYASPSQVGIYASNTGYNFNLNQETFLGNWDLDQTQGQHIRLYPKDFRGGIASNIDLNADIYLTFRPKSKVAVGPPFMVGAYRVARTKKGEENWLNRLGQADLVGQLAVQNPKRQSRITIETDSDDMGDVKIQDSDSTTKTHLQPNRSIISASDSTIHTNSTGSVIVGGSGHDITGSDYSTSVGGYNNDIYI